MKQNPGFMASSLPRKKRPEPVEGQDPAEESEQETEEAKRARIEHEMTLSKAKWEKHVISQHLVFVRGVEIVFFEFKEILLDIALKLRDVIDPKTGKSRVILTKFIEDWILKKL